MIWKLRLRRFNTETANGIVVLTLKTLDGEDIDSVARSAFDKLPLSDAERQRSVLLVVARSERQVSVHAGSQVRALLPEPAASQKLLVAGRRFGQQGAHLRCRHGLRCAPPRAGRFFVARHR